MNICMHCSKSTRNLIFCSRKCANTYRNLNNHPRKKSAKGKPFCKKCKTNRTPSYGNRLCHDCSINRFIYCSDPLLIELKLRYKNSKHSTGMQAYIRGHARDVIFNKNKKSCEKCGYNHHIEICHIKPICSFSDQSKLSEINNIDNLIGLCPNCHWELDNGILLLSELRVHI